MIRSRLTRWVMALVAVVLVVFAVSVFWITRAGILAEVERDLAVRADGLAGAVAADPGRATDRAFVAGFGSSDVVVVIYDASGLRVVDSGTLPGRVPGFPVVESAGSEVVEVDVAGPLYLATRSVRLQDGTEAIVAVGRSPERLYEALARLAGVLLPTTVVALVAIGAMVFILVRRALRPLEELAAEAGRVARAGDHTARLDGWDRPDEVGNLARSLDSMLLSLAAEHELAQRATRGQRVFLAEVSHELRAPLTIVSSSLQLAERVSDDNRRLSADLLRDARAETDRMGRIVSRLLLMSRTTGESRAADSPLLLGELVSSVCRRWSVVSPGAAIDRSGLVSIADVVVYGNDDHLRQVFDILLDNAVKYSDGDPRIEVGAAAASDRRLVTVAVSDDGPGLSADEIELVFDRFHRGDEGGTGLGLAIARHVVESHGGAITAKSRPGGGTTFTVQLPMWFDEAPAATDQLVQTVGPLIRRSRSPVFPAEPTRPGW